MPSKNLSLNGLRVFEAAARHLSFTAAAEELHVTQAAVSQQVRTLEKQLSVHLFSREKRALVLTEAGQDLARTTRDALDSIQASLQRISTNESTDVLTISTIPSFASRWLVPRLSDFQRTHADIALHVHSSDVSQNLKTGKVDAAIRWAGTDQPGLCVEKLMSDAVCLVSAPALAEQLGTDPANLSGHTLIVDGNLPLNSDGQTPVELQAQTVLENLSIGDSPPRMLTFNQSDNVVLSALAGQGVGLTRLSLCADELQAGQLIVVFGYCRAMNEGYSLVYPEFSRSDSRLTAFRSWLLEQTSEFRVEMERETRG
ncbi:MAG: LysR family transcriptional regulator [Gammaproteobacteria bacterium]|nr:LysR family transcriptional regulator [Gammaproteobacteria bacterium]